MEENKCIICETKDLSFVSRKNEYDFYKCNKCGLIYVYPKPNLDKLIENCYSQNSEYHSKLAKNLKSIKKYKKSFVKILDELSNLKIKGNLLDVGCSNGEFLCLAEKRGFNAFGVEINKRTASIAKNNGLNVFDGTLENANFNDKFFSVIHLGDIIEHTPEPIVLLRECRRILKKNGIMIISTPNIDCFWARATHLLHRLFYFPWSILIPPYHLFMFSQFNFKKLLYKTKFKIFNIKYQRCSLRHELGSTDLYKKIKQENFFKYLLYTFLVFPFYILIYCIDFLITPFKNKDFEMIIFCSPRA